MQKITRKEICYLIEPELEIKLDVNYSKAGSERQNLHFLKRKDITSPKPLIVYIHGGAWLHGDKDFQIPHLYPYAKSGDFITACINYRFSSQQPWPAQLNDCQDALNHLIEKAEEYCIDTDNIALWGSSSGAHLTLSLANQNPQLKGCVSFCAPSNFRPLLNILQEQNHQLSSHLDSQSPLIQLIGENPVKVPHKLLEASPWEGLNSDTPPLLLVHGTKDLAVPYQQSLDTHLRAKELGINSTLITLDNYGHKFSPPKVYEIVQKFFRSHLLCEELSCQDLLIKHPCLK